MTYRDDPELFSIGQEVQPKRRQPDTVSDASDWVRQYMEWGETSAVRYATSPYHEIDRVPDRPAPSSRAKRSPTHHWA